LWMSFPLLKNKNETISSEAVYTIFRIINY
jgi:hypothetical protein